MSSGRLFCLLMASQSIGQPPEGITAIDGGGVSDRPFRRLRKFAAQKRPDNSVGAVAQSSQTAPGNDYFENLSKTSSACSSGFTFS